jgi:uncharacterized protein YbjT (DUF2867 family)
MAEQRLLAVTGATGFQGGGVVRAALADPQKQFRVRALTRKIDSDKAQALAAQGVEVVAADLDDEASLVSAFNGTEAAYCVTNFWEHFSPTRETAQGSNLARAAHKAGIRHAIWSTFEDVRKYVPLDDQRMPTLQGNYKVPHFDAKAEANAVFTDLGVPTTFLLTSYYWDNMIFFGMEPKKGPDGVLAITMPMDDKKLPGIAGDDIGWCAYGIFAAGDDFIGKTVGIAGDHLTGNEMAAGLSRALGQQVRYNAVPPDVYRAFGFPGADDMGNMFQFKRDFNEMYCGNRPVLPSRALYPGLQTFETWLSKNATRIPLA